MRAMSEAIEGARDFRGMMDKIEAGAAQQANALRLHQAIRAAPQPGRANLVRVMMGAAP